MRIHAPLALALCLSVAPLLDAQARTRVDPSGRATTQVSLTLADTAARAGGQPPVIRIDHGQPHLRGRTLHTENLVPYDRPWRTGANDATTFRTDVDLVIGGSAVPRGTYVIHTLPTRSGWTLLLQREGGRTPMQAAMNYDPALEVARIPLRRTELATPMESLTFWLVPSNQPGAARGELRFAWGSSLLSTEWEVR